MSDWFTFSEILACAQRDLPNTERSLRRLIQKEGWKRMPDVCQKRAKCEGGDLFHISLLPGPVQLRLKAAKGETPENRFEDAAPVEVTREALWDAYERLPADHKQECQSRLDFLNRVDVLIEAGSKKQEAIATACGEFGHSISTYRNWALLVKPWQRADWLAALAPQYKTRATEKTIHPDAWAHLKTDYLRPEKPTLAACYRRMKEAAKAQGWSPVPSLRTVRRWVERELPRSVQVRAREKGDISKQLFPSQRRTRSHLHAMEMVNIDGHKFDVFVKFEDGRIGRPIMLAIQDLYSNLFVAHRIDETENKGLVRLAIGDMMENYGIPRAMVLDNGRAFASKWITGGAKTRYRYKIRDEEPNGLLVTMGVEVKWTLPYSGQSKPIERAFRDLCDTIARHPFCAGAYTGNTIDNAPDNRGSKAIPIADFRAFVAEEINRHNQRTDRNTETAKGRSFLEVFQESMAKPETLVAMPTEAQRKLWLLAAEQVPAQRGSGEIHLHGTRYWCTGLNQWAGKKLTVRYDPQNLHKPVSVYDLKDRFLFEAEAISDVRFDDVEQSRLHARKRSAYMKAVKTQTDIERDMELAELSRLQPDPAPHPDMPKKKVRRIAVGNAALKPATDSETQTDFNENLAKAMKLMADGNVLPFRKSDE